MFAGPFEYSIVKRAQEKKLIEIDFVNIRDFGEGPHKTVDDTEYGGGIGMLLKVDVVHQAILSAKDKFNKQYNNASMKQIVVLMSAAGKTFQQAIAKQYSELDHLIIICGHYEGVDDRIKHFIDEEISIGDFILTGGEIPAMLIADAITRLIPGVLPKGATEDESFTTADDKPLLEYPHYTKPQVYKNYPVPEILLSGNHKKIAAWRKEKAIEKTQKIRPDLLK